MDAKTLCRLSLAPYCQRSCEKKTGGKKGCGQKKEDKKANILGSAVMI